MQHLFSPFTCKGLELNNRIVMPPMCQYSAKNKDGVATDWHYVHYVSRAVGGTGLIIVEMTNVEPHGRISDFCLGLWDDAQIGALAKIVEACHAHGTKVAIQIAHAGRKAEDTPEPVAPSAIPFDEKSKIPRSLTTDEVKGMVEKFRLAARRAVKAGMDAIELHGAHGYLIHQFHSRSSNQRVDAYGEDLRLFGTEVIQAVKSEMPAQMPLLFRISAQEWIAGGYDVNESLDFSREYKKAGVDIFHVSAGGEGYPAPDRKPGTHAGYQVPLARMYKQVLETPVIAVGRLEEASLANAVIGNQDADLIAVGRGMLRNPYWAIEAAIKLGLEIPIPRQYHRGIPMKMNTD